MNDFNILEDREKDYLTIEGVVQKIIFKNDDNGFTVCEVETDDEFTVVAGTLPFLSEGETITILGNWIVHQTFGRQFKAEYYEKKMPSSKKAIVKYLSSGLIRGIGKATAKRIVEQFGEDSFDVLENHPDWLTDVKGISAKKAAEISEEFKNQFGFKNVVTFCSGFFSMPTSVRIYKQFGVGAVDVIKQNPYILCDTVYGINFENADKVANALGEYNMESDERVCAGIRYLLNSAANSEGHLYLPYDRLIPRAIAMLDISENIVYDAFMRAVENQKFVIKEMGENKDMQAVYNFATYNTEKYCATRLIQLDNYAKSENANEKEISLRLNAIEQSEKIKYSKEQKKAVISAVKNGVFVLTGGPGTGKTTVIKALIGIFSQLNKKIALAAPTGRAAKRITETTGMEAKTIHRMLEMTFENETEPKFMRDEENPLEYDVIIVDETSMVDIFLLQSLLRATSDGTKLIFIGDADQLPSVGAGNVLRDIIASDIFTTVRLDTIFRQSSESLIILNAHKINSGEMPVLNVKDKDFFFIERFSPQSIVDTVIDLCKNRLPKKFGGDITDKIQILTPSKKGIAGTVNLNGVLQRELNPADYGKYEKKRFTSVLRENDKVMQIRNNYAVEWSLKDGTIGQGIYNGDIGIIKAIDNINETITVEFDDKTVEYDFLTIDEIIHAFAITIHKAQGSEYPVVILPISQEVPILHTRNLLYTAVTRAQEMVIIVGETESIEYMVNNDKQTVRYTGLAEILPEWVM